MKRLIKNGDIILDGTQTRQQAEKQAFKKLEEFETIEEELGIDLPTLMKYLNAKSCFTKEDGECYIVGINKKEIILLPRAFPYGECETAETFEDYGKTWAVTKEELYGESKT